MPDSAQSPSHRALILLVILTLVWGTNWPLFALATQEISVWTFRAVSLPFAGVALLLFARARRLPLTVPRHQWGRMAAATLAYVVIWNVASTYAAVLIPSGQAAVLGFTMPLWVALMAWAFFRQRPSRVLFVALIFGAASVGLLIVRGLDAYAQAPVGFALGLLAAIGWATGTLILNRGPIDAHPIVLSGWQMVIGSVPLTIAAWVLGDHQWFVPSGQTLLVVLYIAVVPMGIGNVCWFTIVNLLPASVAGLSTVMVPVVAMVSGAIVHGEPLGPSQWAAMLCSMIALWLALPKRPAAPVARAR